MNAVRRIRQIALAGLSGLMLAVLATEAEAACEGITNAFAYNECLAKQAPQRGVRAPRVTSGDPEASVVERRGRRSGRALRGRGEDAGGGVTISRRQGRSSAVIDPWGGVRSNANRRSRRR